MYQNPRKDLVERFENWWKRDNHGLPLMQVMATKDNAVWTAPGPKDTRALYTDVDVKLAQMRDRIRNCLYLGDSFASLGANLGPGSLALYLGTEPRFAWDTVWYEPSIFDMDSDPVIEFDPENKWWKLHLDMIRRLKEGAGDDFLVEIPDLIENLDIFAAMRGPQDALLDLIDEPARVERTVEKIDSVYFRYFDEMREIVTDRNGVSSYTAFAILGLGRTAKIQCDFSAMISPEHFRRFVLPSLEKQTKVLDHSLYHLDGPDAIKHVPALMELEHLDALQWTCGAGQPDGACPRWRVIYDQVAAAGKGLWIQLYEGGIDDWIRGADELIDRYGTKSLYLHFPGMSEAQADKLMNHAVKYWESQT